MEKVIVLKSMEEFKEFLKQVPDNTIVSVQMEIEDNDNGKSISA